MIYPKVRVESLVESAQFISPANLVNLPQDRSDDAGRGLVREAIEMYLPRHSTVSVGAKVDP